MPNIWNDIPGTVSKIVQLRVSFFHRKASFPSELVISVHEATDRTDTDLATETLLGEQRCFLRNIVQETPVYKAGASQRGSNATSGASIAA